MVYRLVEKFGLIWSSLVITMFSVLLSFFIFVTLVMFIPEIKLDFITILLSIIVPFLVAPTPTYFLLLFLKRAKESETKLREINKELEKALEEVKELSGMLPICASCKKVRDDNGYWNQVEEYFTKKSDLTFSHGLCPICFKEESKKVDEFFANEEKFQVKITNN